MEKLFWLHDIKPSDRRFLGDKVFYLSQLIQLGYPVVPGFVIPGTAFQNFLDGMDWLQPLFADLPNSSLHLNVDDPRQLQAIAQNIRQEIAVAPLAESWGTDLVTAAQPFEATALMLRPCLVMEANRELGWSLYPTGLLESQICAMQPAALITGLKQVWAELFRARSLLYWQRLGIRLQDLSLAVLVQPLRSAIASGSLRSSEVGLEIQSVYGLGTALVEGEVVPDFYRVNPVQGHLEVQQLGRKGCAYSVKNSWPLAEWEASHPLLRQQNDCLQVHLLSEAQQNQYALPEVALQQLIQQAQSLQSPLGTTFTLEWTLYPPEESGESRLYFTQVTPQGWDAHPVFGVADKRASSSQQLSLIVEGLAAATGHAIAPAVVISELAQRPQEIPPSSILVTPTITPDWLPWLKQAAGFITEQGGMTSHSAILARELGIPAVVGADRATHLIHSGELVLVDGNQGKIYRLQEDAPLTNAPPSEAQDRKDPLNRSAQQLQAWLEAESMTEREPRTGDRSRLPPIATQLLLNISQVSTLAQVQHLPVDGVGLLRSELMILEALEYQHPQHWLQQGRPEALVERLAAQIVEFARTFAPRPVFYRSLDLRSHEFQTLQGSPAIAPESNPMLGIRGTLSYSLDPTVFDLELAALREVYRAGYANVNLLLPFVRTVEEFAFCRQRVQQAGLLQHPEFQLWIMAEVPSVLFLLPDYVQAGVQGISIGTNDLTQLLLGVDRDQQTTARAFNERHPAVLRAIAQLIELAHQAGIPCSICGQAPVHYPDLIEHLVRWGITSISVDAEAVESTYLAIARAEKQLILDAARQRVRTE